MTLGEKIAALRKQREWTQEDLAEKVGVSKVQVSRWETGRMRPSRNTLKQIAAVLGVHYDDLRSSGPPLALDGADSGLSEKLRQVQELDPEDQAMILRMIDTLVTQKRMARLLSQPQPAGM
ncbi:MAG: helix-turn-helix domain-containing protein [Candidatus Methylomirabilis sp.]|nr:helix-turn-helix domain-containing protein [Deltaproteobacteria bacterium]